MEKQNMFVEKIVGNEKDPAGISDVPERIPDDKMNFENANFLDESEESTVSELVGGESAFQSSEGGDLQPVLEGEPRNELPAPVRNEDIEDLGKKALNGSLHGQIPSVSEVNVERRIRKSAAAALASIHRSRTVYNEESSNSSESEVSNDEEYSVQSESNDTEEEVRSKGAVRKPQKFPLKPSSATTMNTPGAAAVTTEYATAPVSAPQKMLIIPQASCACPEKCISGSEEIVFHSSDCSLSYPEAQCQTPTASQLCPQKPHVLLQSNSSYQQQKHFLTLLTSSDVSKQNVTAAVTAEASSATVPDIETTPTAAAVSSQSPSTVVMPTLQASCASSEKPFSGAMEKEFHSSCCPLSQLADQCQNQETSQQLLSDVFLEHNSSHLPQRCLHSILKSNVYKQNIMTAVTAAATSTTATAITSTAAVTSSNISTSQSPSSVVMSTLPASCACSEKHFSGRKKMKFHSSGCHLSHPYAQNQAQSQQLPHVNLRNNSSQKRFPAILTSFDVAKQEMTTCQIAKSTACENNESDLQVLNVHERKESILKPLFGQNVKNHEGKSKTNRLELANEMSMQINSYKCVKETSIIESAQTLILNSGGQTATVDNFNSRNVKNKKKSDLKFHHDRYQQLEVKSTGTKETRELGKIIIHPNSGLLVCEMSYIISNNNDNDDYDVKKTILYKCLKCNLIFSPEQYQQTHHAPSSEEKQLFECHKCEKIVSVHHELAEHYFRNHHSRKQMVCPICSKVLIGNSLKFHMMYVHTSKRPHACEKCSKTFKTLGCLQSHMVVHSNINNFTCDVCNVSFKRRAALIKHTRIHTGIFPTVKCHICGKMYPKDGFKKHLNIHTLRGQFPCDVCDKIFNTKQGLKQHINNMHGDSIQRIRHICEVCGKTKRSIGALKDHMNIHSGETPYTCHICGKSFAKKKGLSNHLALHEREFKCDLCGYISNRMDNLITHIRSHTGEKPYKCSFCDKAFTRRDNLQSHKRLIHNTVNSESNKN